MADILLGEGTEDVVITDGADGARLYRADGTWVEPAVDVHPVDPIGAGDAFVAGYLSAVLDGAEPQERLKRATRTAGFAVSVHGDWEGFPTRGELRLLDVAPGGVLR
jgi:2-dehydro-3-deoxygluconokinase